MYPLYIENRMAVRKKLQEQKIYIPVLWPDVFKHCDENCLEYEMAQNILPMPIDQRYEKREMDFLAREVLKTI